MADITVSDNGPYLVTGELPIERRRIIESADGEPIAWRTTSKLAAKERMALCRCGGSGNKPFCDGTHAREGFRADDADPGPYADAAKELGGKGGLTVHDNRSICEHAGFCANQVTNVWDAVDDTDDATMRTMVIAMVEHCPSGALTYELDGEPNEPLLPTAIGVIDDGPLWVTGNIPIELADGTELELRNRVVLCRCGASEHKPLCDGSHADTGFEDS